MTRAERQRLRAKLDPAWADFEEVPVDIGTFLVDPSYLNCRGSIRPAVYEDLINLFEGGYTEAAFVEAIGSGKSFKSSCIAAYMLYRVLILRNPQASYHLAPDSKIAIMNMATSGKQARHVVFGHIKARIDHAPWFKNYAHYNPKIKSELQFLDKGVYIVPGNSSENFPLGYDLLAGIMDEAAYYHQPGVNADRDVKDQADEIFTALDRRIKSRYGHIRDPRLLRGMLVMISAPRYEEDFIEKKHDEARTNPAIYSRRRALWEAMPPGTYSGKTFYDEDLQLQIPIEFQQDWKRNKHKARRDFAGRPSGALDPYMDARPLIEILERSKMRPPVRKYKDGYAKEFHQWFRGTPGVNYYAHIDLALSRDACGLAMGHWDRPRDKAVIDYWDRIACSREKKLDYAEVRGVLLLLSRLGFHLEIISYDNFQSVDSRQILEKKGFTCEHLSCDKTTEPYDTFLDYTGQLVLDTYRGPTNSHGKDWLTWEAERLELINGKKVNHPPHGSKDVTDAVAGVCYWIAQERGEPEPEHIIIGGQTPVSVVVGRGR